MDLGDDIVGSPAGSTKPPTVDGSDRKFYVKAAELSGDRTIIQNFDAAYNAQSAASSASASTADPTISAGASGSHVRTLQSQLTELGYDTGGVDGIAGSKTDAAIRAFQAASGLAADGIVGPKTRAALAAAGPDAIPADGSDRRLYLMGADQPGGQEALARFDATLDAQAAANSVVIAEGSSGHHVRDLQSRLNERGYDTGGVDGIAGSQTDTAIRAFQAANGLTVDGIVGPETRAALAAPPPASPASPANTADASFVDRQQDIDLLVTASPYASQAMQKELEEDVAAARGRVEELDRTIAALGTAGGWATETLVAERKQLQDELAAYQSFVNPPVDADIPTTTTIPEDPSHARSGEPQVVRMERYSIEGAFGGGPLEQFEVGGAAEYSVQHLDNGQVLVTRIYSGSGAIETGGKAGLAIRGGDHFEFDALGVLEAGASLTGSRGTTYRLESADQLNDFFVADLSREATRAGITRTPGIGQIPGIGLIAEPVVDSVLDRIPGLPDVPTVESRSTAVELGGYGEAVLPPAWLDNAAQAGARGDIVRGTSVDINNSTGERSTTTYLDVSAAVNGRADERFFEELGLDRSTFDEDVSGKASLAVTTNADGTIDSVKLTLEGQRNDDLYVVENDLGVNDGTQDAILDVVLAGADPDPTALPNAIAGLVDNTVVSTNTSHFTVDSDSYGLEAGIVVADGGLVVNVESAERIG